ncbi:MAG: tRNA (adenosine(37)-N6)-threonylcarbamoyltransferase complex ATPase subunit type 1 TsaE [Thermodesulfobacteriota bacterium]
MTVTTKSLILRNLDDTHTLGLTLGRLSRGGDVICLDGDLGAGKTCLTQSIAKGLEVDPQFYISSPSFAILHEYEGRIPLYHMDFYRLTGVDDVLESGFEEYFYLSGLTVIEWSQRVVEILPQHSLRLDITVLGETLRKVHFSTVDGDWFERLAPFFKKFSTD